MLKRGQLQGAVRDQARLWALRGVRRRDAARGERPKAYAWVDFSSKRRSKSHAHAEDQGMIIKRDQFWR